MITNKSSIVFHKLLKRSTPDSKGFFVIVREDTDKTLKVESDAFRAIKYLKKGFGVFEVARMINRTTKEVVGLIESLVDSGFVKSVDGEKILDNSPKIKPFKTTTTSKQLRFLLSKQLWIPVLILMVAGWGVLVATPSLSPNFRQYFWTKNLFVVYLSLFIFETVFIFLHEMVHFWVTIAVGGKARIRISNRLLSVVAETESYRLSLVDKPKRYLVYLSAMAFNGVVISIIYIFLRFYSFPNDSYWRILLPVIALINIQSVIWQFNLFLQTDIYNFIADFLDNDNLHNNSMLLIAQKLRIKGKLKDKLEEIADDLTIFNKKEMSQLTIYSLVFVLGAGLFLVQYLTLIIPRDLYFVTSSLKNIVWPNLTGSLSALGLILLVSWKYVALGIIFYKKYKNGTIN